MFLFGVNLTYAVGLYELYAKNIEQCSEFIIHGLYGVLMNRRTEKETRSLSAFSRDS